MSLSSQFARINDGVTYPVTEAVAEWDGRFTTEAWYRLREVMEKDFFTAHRGDGSGRIRPSSIGSPCARPALLSFLGDASDATPKSSRSIMDSGTWRHYYWQLVGLSAGFLDDIEVPLEYEPWRLKGAADGMGKRVGVFEFKSVNSQKFTKVRGTSQDRAKAERSHLDQVNAYMVATGAQHASLVYEDRNYLSFVEIRVERDEEVIASLGRRFTGWDAHIQAGTLPPIMPDCWQQSGSVFKYCGWKDACFARG